MVKTITSRTGRTFEVNEDLMKECREFWKHWTSTHKGEYQRITRGLPQIEDVLNKNG